MLNKKIKVLWVLVLVVLSAAAGFILSEALQPAKEPTAASAAPEKNDMFEIRAGGYRFINPLWECDCVQPSGLVSVLNMETALKQYAQQAIAQKSAEHISIYFRDLNNGPWLGIGENEDYSPASLLKVPLLIAALKMAEGDPSFLQQKIKFKAPVILDRVSIRDSFMLKPGTSYTIDELLTRMIVHSDNDAKELVSEKVSEKMFIEVMNHMGIDIRKMNSGNDFLSVKSYASFFRVLYNATYLNREMSEKALGILSQTTFTSGLAGKLPPEVSVSHKFGERTYTNSGIKQLHDCGIVYIPNSPYLLCVMTRGKDFKQLSSAISDISLIVYNNVTTAKH